MDYKYKVGQAVRVRPDLVSSQGDGPITYYKMLSGPNSGYKWFALDKMLPFAGKIVHISEITRNGNYKVKEIGSCVWSDEMFADEPLNECVCRNLL